jgi:uncharacterized protein YndB with AHSA1/START domain
MPLSATSTVSRLNSDWSVLVKVKPASLEIVGGRAVLRFERQLAHPPEKVWRAVTDPDELAYWFPAKVLVPRLRAGEPIRFQFEDGPVEGAVTEGEIVELDPPRVFAFRWGHDMLRFDVVPAGAGCRLLFSHELSERNGGIAAAARNAAGWDQCLGGLTTRLDGSLPGRPAPMLRRIQAYLELFGLGRGMVVELPGGRVVRFERDLVWTPLDRVWAELTGGAGVTPGQAPPEPATVEQVPAGQVTAVESQRMIEYSWLHEGTTAGRVRWEISTDKDAGTRVVLTQELPNGAPQARDIALAAWQQRLDRQLETLLSRGVG